jgi:hypothetical protein
VSKFAEVCRPFLKLNVCVSMRVYASGVSTCAQTCSPANFSHVWDHPADTSTKPVGPECQWRVRTPSRMLSTGKSQCPSRCSESKSLQVVVSPDEVLLPLVLQSWISTRTSSRWATADGDTRAVKCNTGMRKHHTPT